jgi:alpha-L-fucosidase
MTPDEPGLFKFMRIKFRLGMCLFPLLLGNVATAVEPTANSRNKAERLEWFRDLGFGLFIHWSHDSQIGSVISHSMVGADEAYLDRFVNELPKTFNPRKFHPQDWASLAKLAGMRYVMFTTKHHSGFCMYDTKTTDFSITHTPFKRDITAEVFDAFRAQGISAGVYFSPDDFWWLRENKITIQRQIEAVHPRNNPGLMKHNLAQLRELMTGYGKIDMVFFDGETDGLNDLAWDLQPDTVITRGAIKTPEQHIPGMPIDEAWESCLTMGTQWQYKPTNESYMSGGEIIRKLVETRAKGGNLLLNVGPKPDGELPIEQEERLREVALWMFVNGECIYGVRPWVVTNEGDLWFTHDRKNNALYVIVCPKERWRNGEWKDFTLHSVKATARTQVSVLSQNDKALEYQPAVVPQTTFQQTSEGLKIRAMRAQRLYNDRRWPNPVVIKLTDIEPALTPPQVETLKAGRDPASGTVRLQGRLLSLGDAKAVDVSAEFRDITGLDIYERLENWDSTPAESIASTGEFSIPVEGLQAGRTYELRAKVKHPLLTVFGAEVRLTPLKTD